MSNDNTGWGDAGGAAPPETQARQSGPSWARQSKDGRQRANVARPPPEENLERQQRVVERLQILEVPRGRKRPTTGPSGEVPPSQSDGVEFPTGNGQETLPMEEQLLNSALFNPEIFADQVAAHAEETDCEPVEAGGLFETMPVPSMELSGMNLLVTSGQEMVQVNVDQDEVIMACQLCGVRFEGNHQFQVTHCHECDRFKDHGPYDALSPLVNFGSSLNF